MKKLLAYILITLQVFLVGNFGLFLGNMSSVYAEIGDIGHWQDSVWGQIPGTGFWGFDFDQQIRNDGSIYSKPNFNTIELSETWDYLIIATTHDEDNSNGRYNSQLRVSQTAGTGDLFTSHYSGFSRDNSENESWTKAISIVIGASAGSQIQVQKRRDTDAPTWGSIAGSSDVQVIRLTQTNYWIYGIGWTGNIYGGTTPNTVDIDSIVSESDTLAIQGNIATDTIALRGDNKKYLIAWSTSFIGTWNRTQRIGHLEYDNSDILSTRSYCYTRNAANEYCGLGSMDVVETSAADISVQAEIFRGPWVGADQWGSASDQAANTDGNWQMIVLEMPEYLEVFRSEDSVWLQDLTAAQTLNIARDVNIGDSVSFSKNTDSLINVLNPADIFSWANIWTARWNIAAGARQTSFGSITIDGVEQTTWRHGDYSRWNQGATDTFALSFNPSGIFTTSGAWSTLWVNTDPLAGWEAGWNDRTQPGTLGFFAINFDTLIAPEINQSAYRIFNNTNSTDVGIVLAAQNTAATLATNGDAFRIRSLLSVTQNQLRSNEKNLKLQFAERVGVCDINFTWETYADITTSTAIAFNDNATPADNDSITANWNDPVNWATPVINQSYQELNTFTTSVAAIPRDQDGSWDFSLFDNTAPDSTTYCFRIVEDDGTLLDTYSSIPEITTGITPPIPSLSVTKVDNDADDIVNTNQIVRYTITLNNSGTAATWISITDTIDSDFGTPYNFTYLSCGSPSDSFTDPTLTISNVEVTTGGICTIWYDVQVDSAATGWATITNTADPSIAIEGWNDPVAASADALTVRACNINDVSLIFETDDFWEDTFWSLTPNGDACGSAWEIANGWNPNLDCSSWGTPATATAWQPYLDSSVFTEWAFTLTVGTQYDLHVIDDFGDGITVGGGGTDPDLRISQNGADSDTFSVVDDGGVFTFTVQAPLGCDDVVNPNVVVNQAAGQADPTVIDSASFSVVFDEPINVVSFITADITLSGTTGTVTSGPTEVAPNNGTSFEFIVTGMTAGDTVTASIWAWVVEDLVANTNNASISTDNQVTFDASDTTAPTIGSTNFSSGSLLPGWAHTITINYTDADSWIDVSTANTTLHKWDGVSAYGADISGVWLTTVFETATGSSYTTNSLDFGKYQYRFSIDDLAGNTQTQDIDFYIDIPEFIVGTGSVDMWTISGWVLDFSDTITITVNTIWAWFDVTMNRSSDFSQWIENIASWDGLLNGYGYREPPFPAAISTINTDENIATQAALLNTNGDRNSYSYDIQIWALIDIQQAAGDYEWNLDFWINFNY